VFPAPVGPGVGDPPLGGSLVDIASNHMIVSKIWPRMSQCKAYECKTTNGSLNQL
jgi:hypothetical protein